MAAARWSVQPASSGRALSPWSVRPGHLPWRRSPVRVQHAVSTIRFRRPGSGGPAVQCPAVWRPACPVSSPSGVHPSSVHPSGGQPAAGPPPSVRTRPSHPTSGGGVVDQVGAAGNLHHRNGSRSRWASRRGAARSTAEQARTRATLPGSRWSVGVGGGPGPGWVRAAAALDRWGTRQGWPAGEALSLTAALWAREQAAARGGRHGRVAAALGLGWGRPRWVVVVVPDARVDGPGRASRRAGGDGRAAPARPRLAAGAPSSLPTAL
jgi:hypothetical protein